MKRTDDLKAVFGTAARAFMLILAAAAMLTFAGCGGGGGSGSVPDGVWESAADGIKIMLLAQNGRMFITAEVPGYEQASGAAEYKYSFASGKGTISDDSDEIGAFTLSGNTLTVTIDGEEAAFTKVSKPEKSKFDGLWIGNDGEEEVTAAVANGLIFLLDEGEGFAARLTVNGESASGAVEDDVKITLNLKGNTLTVISEGYGGSEVLGTFTKVQRGESPAEAAKAAAGGGGKQYAVVDNDGNLLRVRSEPDTGKDDNIITRLSPGDTVTVLEEGKTDTMEGITAPWFKVRTADGTEGWTFSGFLTAAAPGQPRQEAAAGVKKETAAAQKPAVLAPESDFVVRLNDAGNGAVIGRYTGPGGTIIIPATIQGMPVVAVNMNPPTRRVGTGEYNTFRASSIQSIDDVERVGEKTEVMRTVNTSLISVVIPEGVWWVGGFNNCIALRSVTLPDSVTTIYNRAFQGCTSLASVTIPNSVTTIGDDVFIGCISLASVTIPDSVTEIGGGAFFGCTSLASVTIPDSVTKIYNFAFEGCTNLVTVTISPVKRNWVESSAFSGCPKISLASQAALRAAWYGSRF